MCSPPTLDPVPALQTLTGPLLTLYFHYGRNSQDLSEMAPDRGAETTLPGRSLASSGNLSVMTTDSATTLLDASMRANAPAGRTFPIEGRSFTARGLAVGLLVGLVICFSNMYFGLQTGWVSTMSMPASLLGFGFFKTVSRHLKFPFSPVENVLVQTVAGSMAIMPLGCGFVGVVSFPARLESWPRSLRARRQFPANI